ncbi:hypothetical protein [Arthrobacter sp. M4]|uniref:hypothetical protein n=1 Tax=Arthrobacter sp. M4 TaxID=218160 RepID=UPI001CDD1EF7|nr:hypothetical protein [Arthrobacter sp. M4]MCA4135734.1 hypothetical protein [Arthrobacter sp. M4]
MNGSPLMHFEIRGATLDDLRAFADETNADLGCRGIARKEDEGYVIDAFLPEDELNAAQNSRAAARVTLRTVENLTAVGQERQAEVSTLNRFVASRDNRGREVAGERVRGLGEKR